MDLFQNHKKIIIENLEKLFCCRLGGGIFGDTYVGEWTGVKVAVKRITLSVHKQQINTENLKVIREQVTYLR